jgi:hypothetical protein
VEHAGAGRAEGAPSGRTGRGRRRLPGEPPATDAERAVAAAGWIPYWHLDRQLRREDVEIVAGRLSADAACQPLAFNLFVFAGGRFAGTLSPDLMAPGRDGIAGAVRIRDRETVTAEFARFEAGDTSCCPSSRASVRFRIDRTGPDGARVLPIDIRTSRQLGR